MELEKKKAVIEAILFAAGRQIKISEFMAILEISSDEVISIINEMKTIQNSTMNKYGSVKYDAFDDVGGKLSFAFAMLDKSDTGVVLNAVHSRENCFLYIKEIVKGESYIMLSEEEIEALRIAKASRE